MVEGIKRYYNEIKNNMTSRLKKGGEFLSPFLTLSNLVSWVSQLCKMYSNFITCKMKVFFFLPCREREETNFLSTHPCTLETLFS